jgi:hypothetical protein
MSEFVDAVIRDAVLTSNHTGAPYAGAVRSALDKEGTLAIVAEGKAYQITLKPEAMRRLAKDLLENAAECQARMEIDLALAKDS